MSALVKHLSQYADYHRDSRNIATHIVGIPLIVLAVEVMLSRPQWMIGPILLSPAIILAAAIAIFYLRLDLALGAIMAILLGLGAWIGLSIAQMPTAIWIGAGVGGFVIGWIIQFVGHWFEGRKPAFIDDLVGLIIGPLFIVAEIVFAIGFRRALKKSIETPRQER